MKRSILLLVGTACLTFSSLSHGVAVDGARIIEADRNPLLPLRLISDAGVFVVYDAAVPLIERDARARYVGWGLGADDEQVYVYPALLYNSRAATTQRSIAVAVRIGPCAAALPPRGPP